jgi:hypothetical protein
LIDNSLLLGRCYFNDEIFIFSQVEAVDREDSDSDEEEKQ